MESQNQKKMKWKVTDLAKTVAKQIIKNYYSEYTENSKNSVIRKQHNLEIVAKNLNSLHQTNI